MHAREHEGGHSVSHNKGKMTWINLYHCHRNADVNFRHLFWTVLEGTTIIKVHALNKNKKYSKRKINC